MFSVVFRFCDGSNDLISAILFCFFLRGLGLEAWQTGKRTAYLGRFLVLSTPTAVTNSPCQSIRRDLQNADEFLEFRISPIIFRSLIAI